MSGVAAPTAPVQVNPFPGLRPFETEEADIFFGRENDIDDLLVRLRRSRFLAVVGSSGCGKSSLIKAGLIAALRDGFLVQADASWRVAVMRPGNQPVEQLAVALARPEALGDADEEAGELGSLLQATLGRGPMGLVEAVRESPLPGGTKLLVLVDQFEELFRFIQRSGVPRADDTAQAFVKVLLAATLSDLPIYVVLTMRSEYLGHCSGFPGLPEAINDGLYLVPQMTRDELRDSIVQPIERSGGQIAPRLVDRVLNDLGAEVDQLPVLQHALMRLWSVWVADGRRGPLDLPHYERIGTLATALSNHIDAVYREELDPSQQRIAESLFRRLTEVTEDGRKVRRPAALHEICEVAHASPTGVIAVIDRFRREGRSFLMPPPSVPLEAGTIVDISHESLIRQWQRLDQWADGEVRAGEMYRRLSDTAARWREDAANLWHRRELRTALEWRRANRPSAAWARRYGGDFALAMEFLDRSERSDRWRRFLVYPAQALLALLIVLAIAAAGAWAWVTWTESGLYYRVHLWDGPDLVQAGGMQASDLVAWAEAQARWGRFGEAEATLRRIPTTSDQGGAVLAVVRSLVEAGDLEGARRLAGAAVDPAQRAQILARVASEMATRRHAGASATAREALAVADEIRLPVDRAQSLADVTPALLAAGQRTVAEASGRAARDILAGTPEGEAQGRILAQLATALAAAGLADGAQEAAGLIADPEARVRAFVAVGRALARSDQRALATRPLVEAARVARSLPDYGLRARLLRPVPGALRAVGRPGDAAEIAREARQAALAVADSDPSVPLADLVDALAEGEMLDEALATSRLITDRRRRQRAQARVAVALVAAGRPAEARQLAGEISDPVERDLALKEVALLARDPAESLPAAAAIRAADIRAAAFARLAADLAIAGKTGPAGEAVAAARQATREIPPELPGEFRANALLEVASALAPSYPGTAVEVAREAAAGMGRQTRALAAPALARTLARAGQIDSALAAAETAQDAAASARTLVAIAEIMLAAPTRGQGLGGAPPRPDRAVAIAVGRRAVRAAGAAADPLVKDQILSAVAAALLAAGERDAAAEMASAIQDPQVRGRALDGLVAALAASGALRGAWDTASTIPGASARLGAYAKLLIAWKARGDGTAAGPDRVGR